MNNGFRNLILSGTAGAALICGSMGGLANAAVSEDMVDFDRVGYREILRTAAIEPYTDLPRHVPTEFGYSLVSLIKDVGSPARCETNGGVYWLDEIVEEGVIKGGAGPVSEENTAIIDTRIYDNATLSRSFTDAAGESSGIATADRTPKIPADGTGPLLTSECSAEVTSASGTGDIVNAAGVRVAGSTSSAATDKRTGKITSPVVEGNLGTTARAGTIGQDSGLRLASITWTGDNFMAESRLRPEGPRLTLSV